MTAPGEWLVETWYPPELHHAVSCSMDALGPQGWRESATCKNERGRYHATFLVLSRETAVDLVDLFRHNDLAAGYRRAARN